MNKTFDIYTEEPRTRQEYISRLWNHTQTSLLIKRGQVIPVYSMGTCWSCDQETLLSPYSYYCSERCSDIGANQEERRDEE